MTPGTIRWLVAALILLVFVWERILDLLNLRRAAALRERPPELERRIVGGDTFRRAVDYTLARGRLGLVSSTVSAGFTLALILSGALGTLERLAGRLPAGDYFQGVLFLWLLGLLFGLLALPFSWYARFVIEERFGFNRMSPGLFLLDRLKSLLLSAALLTPLLYGLFVLVDRGGAVWWLWAFLLVALFQLGLTVLYPTLIAPLFNRFTPLPEGSLRQAIEGLALRLGFRTRGIFVMDSSRRSRHSNAYFTGLGRAKRIVLFDTLLEGLEERQIAAVLAHEIGHYRKRHVPKMLLVSLAFLLAGFAALGLLARSPSFFNAFGLGGPSPAGLFVVALFLSGPIGALFQPLISLWSRRHEYQADRVAVQAMGEAEALKGALIRLNGDNLSNPVPHPWYSFYHYSHPPLPERIRALEA